MTLDALRSNNPFLAADPSKVPAHQVVYNQLRFMILFGDLAPGQAVTIQGLTADLDAGMTPVREALRRLTAEGALTLQGNRRVSVPVLTPECIEELDFMRKTLEAELARRAATRISKPEILELTRIDDKLNTAIQAGDVGAYLTHNHSFHSMIYSVAQAPILTATVDRLWLRFGPSLRVVCGRFGTDSLPDKHQDILSALTQNDGAAAANAMTEDVAQGMQQIKAALQA